MKKMFMVFAAVVFALCCAGLWAEDEAALEFEIPLFSSEVTVTPDEVSSETDGGADDSEASSVNEENAVFYKVNFLLDDGFKKNEEEIASLSSGLQDYEKDKLFNDYASNPLAPFLMNTFIGFGTGSFVQRDVKGRVLALAGEVTGLLIAFTGITHEFNNYDYLFTTKAGNKVYFGLSSGASSACMVLGSALWLGFRAYSVLRPFFYATEFNGSLKKALGLESVDIAAVPVVDLEENKYGFMVHFEIN